MDRWSRGEAYEPYVGRWSRPVAAEFVRWLAVPAGKRWVDVGCGTGALTGAILRDAGPENVLALDPSPGYVAHTRAAVGDPRVDVDVADALALPLNDGTSDVVVSGLVLNFVPDPVAAVAEARRVVRPGGWVAAYVWDYAGGMEMIRRFWDAAVALDPGARALDEAVRFPLCAPERLAETFGRLADVEVTGITVPTVFRDFDDFWTPFLGGEGPAPAYAASLDPERLAALRDSLRSRLPDLSLTARAWAVRGRVR